MTESRAQLENLYVTGAWPQLLARSRIDSASDAQIIRARGLTAQGLVAARQTGSDAETTPGDAAIDILSPIAEGESGVALKASAELLYARYIETILGAQEKLSPDDAMRTAAAAYLRKDIGAQFRATLTAGLIALKNREFEVARNHIAAARRLADQTGDTSAVADAEFALGRAAVWQGYAPLAEEHLQFAISYWSAQGNRLLCAHAAYELAVMWNDLRKPKIAIKLLRGVMAAYEEAGVAKAYLDRARQTLASALVGDGELDEAAPILDSLRGTPDIYRRAMTQRDLARLHLKRAMAAEGDRQRDLFEEARTEWRAGNDLIADWNPSSFASLTFRQLEAEIMLADPQGRNVDTLVLAGDMFARVAEAFSANANERPHEINARIFAMQAYVDAAGAVGVSDALRRSLATAAKTEAQRLNSAVASIDYRLERDALALVIASSALTEDAPAVAAAEESLLAFMRRDLPDADKLEALARLAEALGRVHGTGAIPSGFAPSDVVVRHPGNPAIRDIGGVESLQRPERIGDRPFVAPEVLRGGECDGRSDFYVIGALMIAWFGERVPANEGGLTMWLRRAMRGRPLKRKGRDMSGLALELTSLSRHNRPPTAFECADRLRQVAVRLHAST